MRSRMDVLHWPHLSEGIDQDLLRLKFLKPRCRAVQILEPVRAICVTFLEIATLLMAGKDDLTLPHLYNAEYQMF